MQKRGVPQLRKPLPTTLSAAAARARARAGHTHPTPVRGSAAVPARKTPGPRRGTARRLRTQQHAQHIEGHVGQPPLVEHGLRQDDYLGRAAVGTNFGGSRYLIPKSPNRGVAAAPSDCASDTEGRIGQAKLSCDPAGLRLDLDPSFTVSLTGTRSQLPPLCRLLLSAPARRGRTLSAACCPLPTGGASGLEL